MFKENASEHRIVVYMDDRFFDDNNAWAKRKADELIEQIKRHCDEWLALYYEYDTTYECTYCGYSYEEKPASIDDIQCCHKAEDKMSELRHNEKGR